MKKRIFVDTGAWLALVNKSDSDHQKAKEIRDDLVRLHRQFVVTDYVVVEVANALCRIPFRETAVKLINSIQAAKSIQMVEIDKAIYNEAWVLYSKRPDKECSGGGERKGEGGIDGRISKTIGCQATRVAT